MLSGRVHNWHRWTAPSCECGAKVLVTSCNSSLSPQPFIRFKAKSNTSLIFSTSQKWIRYQVSQTAKILFTVSTVQSILRTTVTFLFVQRNQCIIKTTQNSRVVRTVQFCNNSLVWELFLVKCLGNKKEQCLHLQVRHINSIYTSMGQDLMVKIHFYSSAHHMGQQITGVFGFIINTVWKNACLLWINLVLSLYKKHVHAASEEQYF